MLHSLLTPHQSQYFAWLLTRKAASNSIESLASTLVDAQVDLNPHQIKASFSLALNEELHWQKTHAKSKKTRETTPKFV
jgi:hypothetical protein